MNKCNIFDEICPSLCVKGLRIKETKEVYEGEVIELTPVETENPMGGKYELSNRVKDSAVIDRWSRLLC